MESSTHRNWPAALPDDGGSSSRTRRRALRLPARVAVAVVRGVLTFVFATVGAILGAITGALIGLATESGPVRGAGVGAISGAVVSLEVVESSMAIWRSHESGIWSVLYVPADRPPRSREGRPRRAERRGEPDECGELAVQGGAGADARGHVRRHVRRRGNDNRHAGNRHRGSPGDALHRGQLRRKRGARRLRRVPAGPGGRRDGQELGRVRPHVPPAVHRRLAAAASVLPVMSARGRALSIAG